jgi:2-oxoisovalerate dehydrogenase E1 component alpha subunit
LLAPRPPACAQADDRTRLLWMYRHALVTRAIDERLWILSRQGQVSFVLTSRGHEIAQIAAAAAIRPGQDSAWLYYRDMAVALALGVTPYEVFLGALGRADDPHSGGRQLTIHFSSPRLRIGSVSSVVAAHIPHAVGAAYAARVLGEDSVAFCFFGDGASSEGATHEAMNLAGVQRLPVVFICENNGLAISVPRQLQFSVESLAERAAGYGFPGESLDGSDASAIYRATMEARDRARAGGGPTLLELRVPRMTPHSSQDDEAYRGEAERAAAQAADPIPRLRTRLLDSGGLTTTEDERMLAEVRTEVLDALQRSQLDSAPSAERARMWLYAGDPPHAGLERLETGA